MRTPDEQNFHLLFLDRLLTRERVTPDELEAFVREGVDLEALRKQAREEGIPGEKKAALAVIARLSEYPVSDEDLAGIRTLATDGGDEIYMFIEGRLTGIDTGGEEDWYDTKGSPDIRRCVNVTTVLADCYFQGIDCALLTELPALTEVNLGRFWSNAEALLRVPTLKSVKASQPLPEQLVADLQARGVEVEAPGAATSDDDDDDAGDDD
ncbi:DUF6892 domain-containing protein [Nannocystis punicea]|uniref:DUF6892 domain-containing protein n=1 Tax=Nannocystis punicea TaxID=2995304 RepID=A0ABY7H1H7_9BACT|nr:hypothetical protein [Nannocystis poenicansa]WAS93002.1 hypothetical protein O0S08_43095 [Nannocystis poenicansa]